MVDEESIIFLLSRVEPSQEAISSAEKIIGKAQPYELNWSSLVQNADRAGVSPLLYVNTKNMKGMPAKIVKRLERSYLGAVKKNVLLSSENEKIVLAFQRKNIPCIALKGALASELFFKNIGLYPSGDIDILTKPEDINDSKKVLRDLGYFQVDGLSEEDYLKNHYHLPPYVKGHFTVEVHWNLVKRYFFIPAEFWWEDTQEYESNGMKYITLSPEKYLLYAIYRLYSHGFRPLRFLVLVAEMINHYRDEMQWDIFLSYANNYRLDRLILFALKLARDVLDALVPDFLVEKKVFAYGYLKRKIIPRFFQEEAVHSRNMILYFTLQRNIRSFGAVALRRLTPSMSEIRMRYGLRPGSKKAFIYYLLNPLLMILGKKKLL